MHKIEKNQDSKSWKEIGGRGGLLVVIYDWADMCCFSKVSEEYLCYGPFLSYFIHFLCLDLEKSQYIDILTFRTLDDHSIL